MQSLFGVNSIDGLKECIKKCQPDREMRYSMGFSSPAPAILNYIKIEDIGILP